jgi:hypothetical protein
MTKQNQNSTTTSIEGVDNSRVIEDPLFPKGSLVLILDCSVKGWRGYPKERVGTQGTVLEVREELHAENSKTIIVKVIFEDNGEMYDFFPNELNPSLKLLF